jgi:3'(2'), 5'-bisphosphate nucleotidase
MLMDIIRLSISAGEEILKVYHAEDFGIEIKEDKSPLTIADKNANDVITEFLKTTAYPILSEEGKKIPYAERKDWKQFWLVDPLDGTKEFIKKNGEFTVNIAFIEKQRAVFGVIYAPVLDTLYCGYENKSFCLENASKILSPKLSLEDFEKIATQLPLEKKKSTYKVVGSRSHMNEETENFIQNLKKEHPEIKVISKGSSLKICLVAEGNADIYPRFGPTMEWDTAAGHAIINNMGGKVLEVKQGKELLYNKENLLNPYFIVYPK